MPTPMIDPGAGGGASKEMAVKLTEALAATYPSAGAATVVKTADDPNVASVIDTATDYTTHRIPEGAETLGEALADLPNDLGGWLTDWLDGFDMTGPLAGLVNVLSGGMVQWMMVAFLGLKIIDLGRGLMAPGQRVRGPVSLVYYQVPTPTVPPVVAYLQNSEQVEVRETVPDGERTRIGVPVYHSGRADRGFTHLQQRTGLEFTKI